MRKWLKLGEDRGNRHGRDRGGQAVQRQRESACGAQCQGGKRREQGAYAMVAATVGRS